MLGYDSMVLGIASQNEFVLDREATAAKYVPGAFKDEQGPAYTAPAYGAYAQMLPASTMPSGPSAMPVPGPMQVLPGGVEGEEAPPSAGPLGLPLWAWIAGSAALLVAVGGGGLGLMLMMRRR